MNFTVLSLESWTSHANKHFALVSPFAEAFVKRRSQRLSHPVHDFLFIYYNYSPLKLKQWVPSFEKHLVVNFQVLEEYKWLNSAYFHIEKNLLSYHSKAISQHVFGLAEFIANLSHQILRRPFRLGCFGLHEWAMVYRLSPQEIRHKGYRLRLRPQELAKFVESQTLCCSHYDAYRFFTKEAQPLNTLNPCLETRLQMEQGGCLHANMDVYKWAIKLWPWIGSDFIAKAFFLALEGRELDMRASPYDLTEHGYVPIYIETEEGRRQYQKEQQLFAERAVPLRQELAEFCKRFINLLSV